MGWWKRVHQSSDLVSLVGSPENGWTGQVGSSPINVGFFSYGIEGATIRQWGEGAPLSVGAFCSIAEGLSVFLGGNHRTDWSTTYPFGHINRKYFGGEDIVGHPQTNGGVTIGNDVWIGINVTIMSGVKIGDGAVIAANSTVGKSVGPYEIWGGNPARPIKPRFDEHISRRLYALRWWECSITTIRELAPLLSIPPEANVMDRLEEIVARDPAKKEGPGKTRPSQG